MNAGIYQVVEVREAKQSFKLIVADANGTKTIIKGRDILRSIIVEDLDEENLPSKMADLQNFSHFSEKLTHGEDFEFPEYIHVLGVIENHLVLTNFISK